MENESQVSETTYQDIIVNADVGIEDAVLFTFGLPSDTDDAMRERFEWYAIEMYRKMEWTKLTPSEYFAEDSATYTSKSFASKSANSLRELRGAL